MLKIQDLVKNGKIPKDYVTITEKKTDKTKKFYIGDIVKKVIEIILRKIRTLRKKIIYLRAVKVKTAL